MSDLRSRLLTLTLASLVSACTSSERMLRVSPLSSDSSPDRVNLWPLLYSDSGAASVLWPIFDIDDRGFALRPLFATDDGSWSVLYPLSEFDGDTGQGWAIPFYRTENHTGLFPIANLGRFSYVGPVWWRPEQDTGGLFPIVYFGESVNYVGPAWWVSGGESHLDGGLFPIATFGRFNYVTLFWWMEGFASYGLFPLFGTGSVRHVGPFWWKRDDAGALSGGLFPLIHMDPESRDFAFQPFYSVHRDDDSVSRNVLLGLGHSARDGEREESWIFPLYYRKSREEASETALVPFYWRRTRGEQTRTFTLLGHSTSDSGEAREGSRAVYPLWWSGRSKDARWQMLLPFFYTSTRGEEHTLLTPLGGYGWGAEGEQRYLNVLGPLFHSSRSADGSRERTAFLWPFYDRARDGDTTSTRVLPLFATESSPASSKGWYALGLGHVQRDGEAGAHRLWPLYAHSELDHPGAFYELTLYHESRIRGTQTQRLFPLYSSERTRREREVNLLLGLGNYRRRDGQKSWAFWPLVSRATGRSRPGLAYDLTLVGSARWEGGRSFHVAGPLIYSDRSTLDAETRERKRRLLLLYTIDDEERLPGRVPEHIPRDNRLEDANRIQHRRHVAFFGAFLNESETFRVWGDETIARQDADNLRAVLAADEIPVGAEHLTSARRFLTQRGVDVGPGRAGLRAATRGFAESETVLRSRRHVRVPLLYGYERTADVVEQYGPLWIVQSRTAPDSSRFRFLYYLYRSERKGQSTTRDVFPFVTADTSPEASKFTFLWHFLHYERRGDRRGGHVLFIPWGRL